MKTLISIPVFLLLIFSISSCKKTSTIMLNERVDTSSVLKLQGTFMGIGSERVTGQAKIYLQKEKYHLALENFTTTNGPDLKVYLSQQAEPNNFIKLGDLKSTNGNQVYDITGMPDFTKYKYVLIHCERFNHLYGSAQLK
ncbi:MAG: DM13 domain-containing protein [Segetibacter sp.]|nr:DM13 domain-containing protein [Segetibacter sp.]